MILSMTAAVLSLTAVDDAVRADTLQWLVLEFPDGARGGDGRIRGDATPSNPKAQENLNWIQRHIDLAGRCGAEEPMYSDNISHRWYIVSWSSPNDRAVVACVKASVSDHFNAGIAPVAPYSMIKLDPTPFRDFETLPLQSPAKAR